MVIFRENTEDVYAGIEWKAGSDEANRRSSSSSPAWARRSGRAAASASSRSREFGSKRLVRKAIQYAIAHNRKSVTLVHKGNIHEVHRGGVQGLGLPGGARGVRRRHDLRGRRLEPAQRQGAGGEDRDQGPHRRLDVPAGRCCGRTSTRSWPPPTSTATISPTPWPPRWAGSASPPAATRGTASRSSRRRTAPLPSTPTRTRSTPAR